MITVTIRDSKLYVQLLLYDLYVSPAEIHVITQRMFCNGRQSRTSSTRSCRGMVCLHLARNQRGSKISEGKGCLKRRRRMEEGQVSGGQLVVVEAATTAVSCCKSAPLPACQGRATWHERGPSYETNLRSAAVQQLFIAISAVGLLLLFF